MSRKALRRDEFLRHLLWMSVLAAGIVLYYYRLYDMGIPSKNYTHLLMHFYL